MKNTGLTLAAAGSAPMLSAPFVSKALAANKSLSIVQWAHFVPEYDTWFDKFAKDWGDEEQDRGHGRPRSRAEHSRTRGRGSVGRIGTRSFRVQRRRRRASLPQVLYRRRRSREGNREKVRQGLRHRQAARLQRGRRHLVRLPRFLHQLPGHVSKEHVGRDRDDAGHLGQPAHRRRQAEGEGPSRRHLARAQQRPEHDLARPVVELWRRRCRTRPARKSCSTARRRSRRPSTLPRSTRRR